MIVRPDDLTLEQGQALLRVARTSAERAALGEPEVCSPPEPGLDVEGASFVTVYVGESLNGCLGSLAPRCSLHEDVAHNAYHAAIGDPRFAPLSPDDLSALRLHVSVLSALERLEVSSFETLHQTLRPGTDGLLIAHGARRGTFLPSVWEKLPEPNDFLDHLWVKARLQPGIWPRGLEVFRYTTRQFES